MDENTQPSFPPTAPTPATPVDQSGLSSSATPTQVFESPKSGGKRVWVLLVVFVVLLVGAGAYFVSSQGLLNPKPAATATPVPAATAESTSTPTSDPTADWEDYTIRGFNVRFKLPNTFSLKGELGEEIKGDKGNALCVTFSKKTGLFAKEALAGGAPCSIDPFGIGTTSLDYEAGREGGFGDLQGYLVKDGKYFVKFVADKEFEVPEGLGTEITNQYKVKILKINGQEDPQSGYPDPATPGEGYIGALVNLTGSKTYSGFALGMKIEGEQTEELFDQILSTFNFIEPTPTPSAKEQ